MAKRGSTEKGEVIARMIEVRQKILDTAMKLPPARLETPYLGTWTVKDMLAHLAGWDYTNAAAASQISNGKVPVFFEQRDKDWKSYNQALIQQYGRGTVGEVIDRVRQSHRSLINQLGATTDADFNRPVAHGKRSLSIASLLNAEVRDEMEHLEQLCALLQVTPEAGNDPRSPTH